MPISKAGVKRLINKKSGGSKMNKLSKQFGKMAKADRKAAANKFKRKKR